MTKVSDSNEANPIPQFFFESKWSKSNPPIFFQSKQALVVNVETGPSRNWANYTDNRVEEAPYAIRYTTPVFKSDYCVVLLMFSHIK